MPYLTQANYIARFGEQELIELTDRESEPTGTVDASVFAAAEADASALIDGYLRSRYTVPIALPTGDLRVHAGSMARAILYRDGQTQAVADDQERAMEWLRDVAAGRVVLDAATATPAITGGTIGEAVFNDARNDFAEVY
jgi:phage gp36-like protein